ncbi:MAG: hypothetical protein AB2L14_11570 [Candidatus Xenobiia bacterium LiM19]
MSHKKSISYKLYSEYLSATGYLDGEVSKITYVEHQDVRDAVMALVEMLLSGYEHEIFSQICGCCGKWGNVVYRESIIEESHICHPCIRLWKTIMKDLNVVMMTGMSGNMGFACPRRGATHNP